MHTNLPSTPYEESRVLSTRVPPDLHRRLRLLATERDTRVSLVVRLAVERLLDAESIQ
jgi:predicted transcriptional regulator